MHAIIVRETGEPSVLKYEQLLMPVPSTGEVLIKVYASGVNPADAHVRSGFRALPEALRPVVKLPYTPGSDLAGLIVGLGPGVTGFKINDAVFGLLNFPPSPGKGGGRTYAEYAVANVTHLALKPENLSFAEAAAIPMAALTAWQQLCVNVPVQPGQTVMVRGAAGGVGHFAVQFAKHKGAKVIAVASAKHKAFLSGLGADEFWDYTTTDISKSLKVVDLLFNCVGASESAHLFTLIKPGGTVISLMPDAMIPQQQKESLMTDHGIMLAGTLVHSNGTQLTEISDLFRQKKLEVKMDSIFLLRDAAKAHAHAEKGHLQGKISLQVI